MVLLQASHCSKTSQIRAYTLQSTENVGVYLRDHALHYCQVFGDDSRVEDGTAKQSQVRLSLMLTAPNAQVRHVLMLHSLGHCSIIIGVTPYCMSILRLARSMRFASMVSFS